MKKKTFLTIAFLLIIGLFECYSQKNPNDNLDQIVDHAIKTSLLCMEHSIKEVASPYLYPTYGTKELKWKLDSSSNWVSGFYPGSLWYSYELSKDPKFKKWAEEWTAGIESQKFNNKTHDLGFRFGSSFGNGLRFAPNDPATARYKKILLTAAATADSRYSPSAGVYPSDWDAHPLRNSEPMVIDIMMDIELLMWAAHHGGDPAIMDRCQSHAAASYRDLIRDDGGSFHVVRYNKVTGKVMGKGQLQGDTDSSTWSRGQAWMVYGLVTMYRYTKDPKYLKEDMKVANYFINHLPKDQIANWDFQSRLNHRDASASAIVASALFELQAYLKNAEKRKYYLNEAEKILRSLCLPPYFSDGKGTNCLLLKSTQYFHKTDNTDVPSTFADYYFLESLVRYKRIRSGEPPVDLKADY